MNLKFFKPSTKRAAILVAIEPAELTDVRDEIDTKYEAIYLSYIRYVFSIIGSAVEAAELIKFTKQRAERKTKNGD